MLALANTGVISLAAVTQEYLSSFSRQHIVWTHADVNRSTMVSLRRRYHRISPVYRLGLR